MKTRIRFQLQPWLIVLLLSIAISIAIVNAQEDEKEEYTTAVGESCLAVIKDIFEEDRRELLCQTPSGMLYTIPSVDDAWIARHMNSGELVSGEVMLDIPLWTQVDRTTETLLLTEEPQFMPIENGRFRENMKTSGERTVLAVRVVAADSTLSQSEDALSQAVFGGPNDQVNLKTQFYACSHGKLNFQKRPNLNGLTTNIRNGVVTIKVNLPVSVGHPIIVNAVSEIILEEFGIARQKIADHVMYCLPTGVFKGVAYAIMNRGLSVYNDKLCTSVSAQMHEFGHNMNLGHSAEKDDEYGDQSGMMGYSYPHSEVPKMCFNAAKTYQLGWFRDKSISYTPGKGVWSLDQTFTIASMVDYRTTNGYVIVQMMQPTLGIHFYLGLNAAKGFNAGVRAGIDKVLLFEKPNVDGTESRRLADLSMGQSYTIKDFDGIKGDKLVISILELNLFDPRGSEAEVRVQFQPKNGRSPTRPPTRGPTRPPTRAPTPRPTIGRAVDGRNPTITIDTVNSAPNCKGIMAECSADSECCAGFSCRRVSLEDGDVCRAISKDDKNKLPRVNINWWNRRLRGDDNVNVNQELEEEKVVDGESSINHI